MLNEFQIIQRYFNQPLKHPRNDVALGIGDDCAIVEVPPEHQLALSIDTFIAGVHFPLQTSAEDIGHKALAVNLSDLAAMGASPAWITLALTLPEVNKEWLAAFAKGLFSLAERYQVALIGGDTTRGPLSISIQAHGFIPKGAAITREGAQPGDLIFVTNTLGDAGLALKFLNKECEIPLQDQAFFLQRFNRPQPRVKEGILLRHIASAMIDISDGLVADLGHILQNSHVGALVNIDKIPLSSQMARSTSDDFARKLALSSGDDYELCFTVPPEKLELLEKTIQTTIACIGKITTDNKLRLITCNGEIYQNNTQGYKHF